MKKVFFILLNFLFFIGHSQIYNKWYQTKFVYNNIDSGSLLGQSLFPVKFEITEDKIVVYDILNKDNFTSYDSKSNIFYDGIRLFNTSGGCNKYKIDSVSKDKLILSTSAIRAKVYYQRYINHDYKRGTIELIDNNDTITKYIKVLPEFKGGFTSLLIKNFNHSKFNLPNSKIIRVAFLVHNSGMIDSIDIAETDTIIKNEITKFLLLTNGKWKISKRFKNYQENKIQLNLIIMSEMLLSMASKYKNKGITFQLYLDGCNYFNNKDYKKALNCFTELIICKDYSSSLNNYYLNETIDNCSYDYYNSAIMNRAATFYKLDMINEACKDWNTILNNKPIIPKDVDEARENIRKFCK